MKSKVLPFVTILMVLMLSACASAISAEEQGGISADGAADSDKAQDVIVVSPSVGPSQAALTIGDTLVVQIPTIPEEGYQWVLKDVESDVLLQKTAAEYKPDPDSDSAGGITEFTFVAVEPGEVHLSFEYQQVEGEFSKNTYGLTVTVTNGEAKTLIITPSPTGNSANLAVGDTLVIEIPTMQEEDYQWVVKDFDPNILEQIGAAEYIDDPDAADGGGITRVEFKALSAGELTLSLEYTNANADTAESISKDTFSVQVIVE